MSSSVLSYALEDLNALILAAEPHDIAIIQALRKRFDEIALNPESVAAADSITLACAGMKFLEDGKADNPDAVLHGVACAVALASRQLLGPVENDAHLLESCNHLTTVLSSRNGLATNETERRPDDYVAPKALRPVASVADGSCLPPDADLDIIREFISESCDHFASAEAAMLALESNPKDAEKIHAVLRAFHSIKGAAGFLSLGRIRSLAHLTENLLIQAREGKIELSGNNADLALRSADILKAAIQALSGITPGSPLVVPEGWDALVTSLESCDSTPAGQKCISPTGTAQNSAKAISESPVSARITAENLIKNEPDESPGTNSNADRFVNNGPSVRVSTERLDELINMVGELVIAHSLIARDVEASGADYRRTQNVGHAGKIVRDLQGLAMSLRMVPLKSTFQKMARLARDLSRKSNKPLRLVVTGEDTEIDRNMVEVLNDPLVHLIRNAVDHGIEKPELRRLSGKDETSTLQLRAYHAAGNVVIELVDDGKGLDSEKIRAKALALGLISTEHHVSENDLYSFIFHPGFSTAEEVTDISGRGVGLDVVKRNIEALRGRVEANSKSGQGATFTLRLPLTTAIVDAMLLRVGSEQYLLPTVAIEHSFRPESSAITTVAGRGEMVNLRDQLLPVFRLHKLFGIEGATSEAQRALLIVIESQSKRCALMVDEIVGQQQVVIKSLGKAMSGVRGVSGGAILGDGRAGLILDAGELLELAQGQAA